MNNTSQFTLNLQKPDLFELRLLLRLRATIRDRVWTSGNISGSFRTILTSPRRNLQRRNNAIGKVINRIRSQLQLELV